MWVAAGTSAASATAVSGFSVFFSGADADSGFAARNVMGSDASDPQRLESFISITCRMASQIAEMIQGFWYYLSMVVPRSLYLVYNQS